MKEKFIDWRPTGQTKKIISLANEILGTYMASGYVVTVRQLYYQFIRRNVFPNDEKTYKKLIRTISLARQAGFIDWDHIEDRGRGLLEYPVRDNTSAMVRGLQNQVQVDMWENQPYYLEVWVEKDALGNVVERGCMRRKVPHLCCRGYVSSSEVYTAGRRIKRAISDGKQCIIIHLGDHDPSGIDMTRDNIERLDMFSGRSDDVAIQRIALNMDQIKKYNPPPNFVKEKDSRKTGYEKQYGTNSWELDALSPEVISETIERAIESYVDEDKWNEQLRIQEELREPLVQLSNNWPLYQKFQKQQTAREQ